MVLPSAHLAEHQTQALVARTSEPVTGYRYARTNTGGLPTRVRQVTGRRSSPRAAVNIEALQHGYPPKVPMS